MSEQDTQETMDHLVWSNEHSAWWRANRSGYTADVKQAGRYTRAAAYAIAERNDYRALSLARERGVPAEVAVPVAEADTFRPEGGTPRGVVRVADEGAAVTCPTFRVRLTRAVCSDLPGLLPRMDAGPGEYDATSNRHGAVSLILPNGEKLGLRPGEFTFAGCSLVPSVFAGEERRYSAMRQLALYARVLEIHAALRASGTGTPAPTGGALDPMGLGEELWQAQKLAVRAREAAGRVDGLGDALPMMTRLIAKLEAMATEATPQRAPTGERAGGAARYCAQCWLNGSGRFALDAQGACPNTRCVTHQSDAFAAGARAATPAREGASDA